MRRNPPPVHSCLRAGSEHKNGIQDLDDKRGMLQRSNVAHPRNSPEADGGIIRQVVRMFFGRSYQKNAHMCSHAVFNLTRPKSSTIVVARSQPNSLRACLFISMLLPAMLHRCHANRLTLAAIYVAPITAAAAAAESALCEFPSVCVGPQSVRVFAYSYTHSSASAQMN